MKKKILTAVALAFFSASQAYADTCYYEGEVQWRFDTTYNVDGMHFWNSGNTPSEFTLGMGSVNTGLGLTYTQDWQYFEPTLVSPMYDSTINALAPTLTVGNGIDPNMTLTLLCVPPPATATGNVLVNLMNSVSGDAVIGTQDLSSGNTGQVIIGFLAIALLLALAWYVRRTYGKSKG